MRLLQDGNSINFQKASYTLDGCVKIYTSRVDSVMTDTGRLLTGLSESTSDKKSKTDQTENFDEDGEGEDEDEEGNSKKQKKRVSFI